METNEQFDLSGIIKLNFAITKQRNFFLHLCLLDAQLNLITSSKACVHMYSLVGLLTHNLILINTSNIKKSNILLSIMKQMILVGRYISGLCSCTCFSAQVCSQLNEDNFLFMWLVSQHKYNFFSSSYRNKHFLK